MKTILFTLAAVAVCWSGADAGEEGSWFDMENCGFCKHLAAEPGMLDDLVWEHHLIKNGMVTVTLFKDEANEKAFERACHKMGEVAQKMMQGEQVPMCQFCQSMSGIHMTGKIQNEQIPFTGGMIDLTTSNDPEVVKMIHTHGQRTIDEFAAMVASNEGADGQKN